MKIIEDYNKEDAELLGKIMVSCGSDKHDYHNYSHGYSYFFSKMSSLENIKFLEIGISNYGTPENSSLHGWLQYFKNGTIYGIDISPHKMINTENIKCFTADQSSIVDLSKFREASNYVKFNIILDDGSHIFSQALASFNYLFPTALEDGGIYMIEDVGKNPGVYAQSIDDWNTVLGSMAGIEWEIIDCRPERTNDDSVIIGVWKV